ncbi:hypothetical protein [Pseudalkalibacillus hwajinpoensis]|uniref:hypothetical protein n=1 Tax=Guptibacillus hwajinpoensis TaxID=208199 RepID=UPI001CFD3EC5|nr:hypothetical protein [Pseudalkalibacillus hwajinpoensis]
MKKKRTILTYSGTVLSVLFFIALTVDPFREWIFQFLSEREVNYSNMLYNPFTYLLLALMFSFGVSIASLSRKTPTAIKYLCVAVNTVGMIVVGFIVFIGIVL